jgi:hypothetical protein
MGIDNTVELWIGGHHLRIPCCWICIKRQGKVVLDTGALNRAIIVALANETRVGVKTILGPGQATVLTDRHACWLNKFISYSRCRWQRYVMATFEIYLHKIISSDFFLTLDSWADWKWKTFIAPRALDSRSIYIRTWIIKYKMKLLSLPQLFG